MPFAAGDVPEEVAVVGRDGQRRTAGDGVGAGGARRKLRDAAPAPREDPRAPDEPTESEGRRPAGRLVAGLAVTLVGVLGVWFMIAGARHPTAGPGPRVPERGSTAQIPGGPDVLSLDFTDSRHGFALVTMCTVNDGDCGHALLTTDDGGTTWRTHTVPWGPADGSSDSPVLYAFDDRRLVLDAGQDNQRRWASVDGGTTWRPVAGPGTRELAAAPAGDMVISADRDYWDGGDGGPLFALAPDGTGSWLAHQPADIDDADSDPLAAPDGSLWLTGSTGAKEWVEVSRDHGRTWQHRATPAIAGGCVLAVPAGAGVYLGCTGDPALAVYRSTDQGGAWRPVAGAPAWSALVAAGRSMLLCDINSQGVYRTGTDGRFTRLTGAPPATALAAAGAYAVLISGDTSAGVLRYYVTSDGTAWRGITF